MLFNTNKSILCCLTALVAACFLNGDNYPMAREPANSELPAAKRFKEETASLISSEDGPLAIPLSIAEQSPVIAAILSTQGAGQPIRLDINCISLFIISRLLPCIRYINIKKGNDCEEISNYVKSILNFLSAINLFKVLKASIDLGLDGLAVHMCDFIYNRLKNSVDLDEIVFMLKSLSFLNRYYVQKIELRLHADAAKIYKDSCDKAEVLTDQAIVNPHPTAVSVLLIKLNQLDPTKVVIHPYFRIIIENSNTPLRVAIKSYCYQVILKNRPVIAVRSDWWPESKISVSTQIGSVTLVANDQKEFTIARSTAEFSETIKNMIEEMGTGNPIPFKDINSNHLSLIVESLKKIEEIAQIQKCSNLAPDRLYESLKKIEDMDENQYCKNITLDWLFIGKSYDDVIEILKAVNYLDIPPLLEYINTLIVKQLFANNITNISALCTSLEKNLPSELRLLIVAMMKKFREEEIKQFLSKPVKTIKYTHNVDSVSFVNEDKWVLIRTSDKKLHLFDIATSNVKKIIDIDTIGDKYSICGNSYENQLAVNKKGTLCLTALNRKLCLWDLKIGEKIKEYSTAIAPLSVAISPDDKYALTGSKCGIHLRDLYTGTIIKSLKGHYSEALSAVFINNGKQAIVGFSDRTIMIWDLATGQVIKKYNLGDADIQKIVFSASAKKALIVLRNSNASYVLNVESGQKQELKIDGDICSIAISPDGKYALIASEGICLWNLETGKMITQEFNYKCLDRTVKTLASFSSDGKLALLATLWGATLFDLSLRSQLTISQATLFAILDQDSSKVLNCPYFKGVVDGLSPCLQQLIREQCTKRVLESLAS